MKGIIVLNKTDLSLDNQAYSIKGSFENLGHFIEILRNDLTLARITNNIVGLGFSADFCIFLDKDIELARMLEKAGIRVFNRAEAIEICDDKMFTYIQLASKGIAIPDTCSLPIVYRDPYATMNDYESILKECGRPFVLKENNSSLGMGVFLIKSYNDFISRLEINRGRYLAQRFISESSGKDLRIIVIGGKAVAWMKRENYLGDFRSGIATGGKGEEYSPQKEYIRIAEKCAKLLKLDYCGVDLLFGSNGPVLAEVNSNALTQTMERITGVPVTEIYARYILSVLNK